MTTPISGPFSKSQQWPGKNYPGTSWFYYRRRKTSTWYRQVKPYNLPLTYDMRDAQCDQHIDTRTGQTDGDVDQCLPYNAGEASLAYNKAYGKFVDALGERANWSETLLQYEQARHMLVNRVVTLTRFTRKLLRGRFGDAAYELRMYGGRPTGVKRTKSLGDNWLEYHFGWEPLVKDIGSTLEILCQYEPKKLVEAKGVSVRHEYWDGRKAYALSGSTGGTTNDDLREWVTTVRLRAYAEVTNPNVRLLSQLGFINPAEILWNAVPFSFVADWFANVGQVLSSYTDFAGLNISSPEYSIFQRNRSRQQWFYMEPWRYSQVFIDKRYSAIDFKRRTAIVQPKLLLRPLQGFSVTRGTTAIALLLQQLKSR